MASAGMRMRSSCEAWVLVPTHGSKMAGARSTGHGGWLDCFKRFIDCRRPTVAAPRPIQPSR